MIHHAASVEVNQQTEASRRRLQEALGKHSSSLSHLYQQVATARGIFDDLLVQPTKAILGLSCR